MKRKVYNSCVLPAMTYGAEMWAPDQASSRTSKYGKECVKRHIQAQKNKRLGKRKYKGHRRD